ncbi:MAG: DUF92 domain-containing protein [Candidatus Diapherotrites archaeon]
MDAFFAAGFGNGAVIETAFVVLLLAFFSYISHRKKSLSIDGIVAACALGAAIYLLGGMGSFVVMLVFFAVAEFCTKYARAKIGEKHEARTYSNILGNGGAAAISLVLGSPIAFFGAVSSALADTASSEIGMLSRSKPRLITTLEKVKVGADGGVTVLGFAAAFSGAAIIGCAYLILAENPALMAANFTLARNQLVFPIILFSGFLGSFIDSVLGAVLERKGMLTNAWVNFIASSCGAVAAFMLGSALL